MNCLKWESGVGTAPSIAAPKGTHSDEDVLVARDELFQEAWPDYDNTGDKRANEHQQ